MSTEAKSPTVKTMTSALTLVRQFPLNSRPKRSQQNAENSTLSLDLSKSWTNDTVEFAHIERPPDMPKLNYGVLWYHKSEDLLYSGPIGKASVYAQETVETPTLSLWALKPDQNGKGTWSQVLGPAAQQWKGLKRVSRALTAQTADSGFALLGADLNDGFSSGMLQLDMGANTVANLSTESVFSSGIRSGTLQFVPTWGKQGLLIPWGGLRPQRDYHDDNIVQVYDIDGKVWFNQTITGDRPNWR